MGTPEAEIEISEELIQELIDAQCPQFSGEPIRIVNHGWDNVTARVGRHHAARLPRQELAATLIEHEQAFLPAIAARLDIDIPAPVFAGSAGASYPWPWSVVPWIEGETAEVHPLDGAQAGRFGRVLRAVLRALRGEEDLGTVRHRDAVMGVGVLDDDIARAGAEAGERVVIRL